MTGAILIEPRKLQLADIPLTQPAAGEVSVRLQKTGICGSDVHLFKGHRILKQPVVIGHEAIGIVESVSESVTGLKAGDPVVIEPNIPCGRCVLCLSGRGNICGNKRVVGVTEHGCFAEYLNIPAKYCWYLPAGISDEDAVTIEPMAVAYHALFSSPCKPGDNIAVIGLGAIGLLLTHLALKLGYKVWVVEINNAKWKLAEKMGAIGVNNVGSLEENSNQLNQVFTEENIMAVFECGGSEQTVTLAAASAPRGSSVILAGLSEKLASFQPLKIVREGIHIIPSIIYDHPNDFKRTIQLIQAEIISPGFIVSAYYDFQKIQEALETASAGQETKIVINITS